MQKVARVKEARIRRGKGQEKSLKRAMAKKGLMRMIQIRIFHIFVPNLVEIYQIGQK